MDIFFTKKRRYTVDSPIDRVRTEIQSITNRGLSDFSDNITGDFNDDGSFTLTNKWSFAVIRWFENSPAYLRGRLTADDNNTIIDISLRPNSLFVIFFYLIIIFFLSILFGMTFINGPKIYILIFLPVFNLVIYGLIQMLTNGLQNRFEKHLNLQHDD